MRFVAMLFGLVIVVVFAASPAVAQCSDTDAGPDGCLSFNTTANLVSQGLFWPTIDPVASSVFVGVTANTFGGFLDNKMCTAYNADCNGQKILATEHSLNDAWEYTYDAEARTAGRQTWVENNVDFTPSSTFGNPADECVGLHDPYDCCTGVDTGLTCSAGWRPYSMIIDTEANSGGGGAQWVFTANNIRRNSAGGPSNNSLVMSWPFVNINEVDGIDVNNDSGLSNWTRTNTFDPGSAQYGFRSTLIVNGAATNIAYREFYGITSQFDFTEPSITLGYAAALHVPAAANAGVGTTIRAMQGLRIDDLRFDREEYIGGGIPSAAILVREQTTDNGGEGNIVMAGGAYNTGHYVAGSTHLWQESAGILAVSNGIPGSAVAGSRVVTNARSATSGPAAWAANGVSCATACGNIGQTNCANAIALDGTNSPVGDCTKKSGHRLCECY
jgi:hypothetical protein